MHSHLEHSAPSPAEKRNDMLLWIGTLLGPLAMGFNTIVGFTVAHWASDTGQKKFSYLVSGIDLALCVCAFVLSSSLYRAYEKADEEVPMDGRRFFMAKVALLLSVLSTFVVIAGTLAVITLHPAD